MFLNQKGNTLVTVIMASGIAAIIITGIAQSLTMAERQKGRLIADVAALGLQMDIKKGLSTSLLCERNFVNHNSSFGPTTDNVRVQLANSEVIEQNHTLTGYQFEDVNLRASNIQNLGTNSAGDVFYSADLVLSLKRKNSSFNIMPKDIGSIYVTVAADGSVQGCNSSSMFEMVKCGNNELKVSTGSGASDIPVCHTPAQLLGQACPSGHIPVSTGTGITCATTQEMLGSVCASGQVPVSNGSGISCEVFTAARGVTSNPSTTGPNGAAPTEPEPPKLTYNFIAREQSVCEASVQRRLGLNESCRIGGGCGMTCGIPNGTTCVSANPTRWGACIIQ